MVRIYYVANIRLFTTKAHTWQILKTIEALAMLGHRVTLVVPKQSEIENIFSYHKIKPLFSIVSLWVPVWSNKNRPIFWSRSLIFAFNVWFFLKRKCLSTDLVFSRDDLLIIAADLAGKRSCFEVHTARYGSVTSYALRRSTKIVTISEGLEQFLVDSGIDEGKILTVPDGVDLESFEQINLPKRSLRLNVVLPPDKKIICYAGRRKTMGIDKGVDQLLRWFAVHHTQRRDSFLVIVGLSKEELAELVSLTQELRLPADSFELLEYVDHTQLIIILKSADVLVMNYPSISHYTRFMSPLKLFEYMASGVPILAPSLPSLLEVLDGTSAFLFKPGDRESFLSTLEQVFTQSQEAVSRAEKALRIVQNFSWNKRASTISEFLRGRT